MPVQTEPGFYERFSTNPVGRLAFILKQVDLTRPKLRILDLGCGDARMWAGRKFSPGTWITLADVHDSALRKARVELERLRSPFLCRILNMNRLSELLRDAPPFHIIFVNDALYHAEDVGRTIREIYEHLVPGGQLIASTKGKDNLVELKALIREFDPRIEFFSNHYQRFSRESGPELLVPPFPSATWIPYPNQLCIDNVEPVIARYMSLRSNDSFFAVMRGNGRLDAFRKFFEEKLRNSPDGSITVTHDIGLFVATR